LEIKKAEQLSHLIQNFYKLASRLKGDGMQL